MNKEKILKKHDNKSKTSFYIRKDVQKVISIIVTVKKETKTKIIEEYLIKGIEKDIDLIKG
ncbi:MAG: hypothetical protein FWC41_08930 [Firmicutes bacterium]|nr:hypothetical protein [Bacillota bacterium]